MYSSIWFLGLCALPSLAYDPATYPDSSDLNQYVSRPDIRAPRLNVTKYHPDAIKDGYLFFSPYSELPDQPKTVRREHIACQNGAHIYDGDGELVWSGACKYRNRNVHGFRPHLVDGKYQLSLYVAGGNVERGVTEEDAHQSHVILSNQYKEIQRPSFSNVYVGDNFHEFRMLPGGKSAIITRDFRKSPDSVLHDRKEIPVWSTGFREMDLTTGKELFDWSPVDSGIDVDESYDLTGLNATTSEMPWDFFHINSVDKTEQGDYIISARHTFTVYKISGETGKVIWRLGGTRNDFKMADGLDFHWQHHARVRFENTTHTIISVFDNNGDDAGRNKEVVNGVSNAVFISLDTSSTPMTATPIRQYKRPDGKTSVKCGSMQMIGESWDNSSVFVNWATPLYVSEHDADDRLVMEARFFASRFNTYRAFKYPFKGFPIDKPAFKTLPIAMGSSSDDATAMYMSWNGATEIESWSIYGSDELEGDFSLLKTVPKSGFETSWVMKGAVPYAYVEALDSAGKKLGRSATYFNEAAGNSSMPLLGDDDIASPLLDDEKALRPAATVTVTQEAECESGSASQATIFVTEAASPGETVYITREAPPAHTVYITKSAPAPAPTIELDIADDEDEEEELSSYKSSAANSSTQKLKELEQNEAFGVFIVSAFALFGLYIALRRTIYIVARWRHGYRPISNLSREPSYTDAEKAG